jgi:hypothetical protein
MAGVHETDNQRGVALGQVEDHFHRGGPGWAGLFSVSVGKHRAQENLWT